jgi:hypothetical protein
MNERDDVYEVMEESKYGSGKVKVWYGNRGRFIGGKPLDASRISMYNEALEGNDALFSENKVKKGEVAMHMVNFVKGICRVERRVLPSAGEQYIGNCEDCIKKLGLCCNVVGFVREKHQDFQEFSIKELSSTLTTFTCPKSSLP